MSGFSDQADLNGNKYSELFNAVVRLSRLLNRKVGKNVSFDQRFGRGKILSLLSGSDGLSQSEIAKQLSLSPPTVKEMLDKLESVSLIERRQDSSDKRKQRVFITESGRNLLSSDSDVECGDEVKEIFSVLTASEQDELLYLLLKLDGELPTAEDASHSLSESLPMIRNGVRL
ncbi:MAG: MarR family transcriptional regulator [Clostridiales bacterium]|nr:MarR family transcriptional regulator [Clostridiales bacterium]